ncbi:MAG TPA: FAD-dependent oxidoreductase, partial [Solirubrobacteraceae bacterium]|nr:FAD-dependent oxidoreductase [Solirubrobacteraceae bacterium]
LRIQNFKSWSPWMVPKGETASSIGMEYFCFEGDELWNMSDDDLVAMAGQEIEKLHLARASKVRFGFVERVHKAYPIYDELYSERVKTIRGWLETIGNLTQVGRNGLHRYNNSDHSMLTSMRAVDNILEGTHHDIWAVNAESVYHEEHQENEDPYRRPPTTPAMEQPLASER